MSNFTFPVKLGYPLILFVFFALGTFVISYSLAFSSGRIPNCDGFTLSQTINLKPESAVGGMGLAITAYVTVYIGICLHCWRRKQIQENGCMGYRHLNRVATTLFIALMLSFVGIGVIQKHKEEVCRNSEGTEDVSLYKWSLHYEVAGSAFSFAILLMVSQIILGLKLSWKTAGKLKKALEIIRIILCACSIMGLFALLYGFSITSNETPSGEFKKNRLYPSDKWQGGGEIVCYVSAVFFILTYFPDLNEFGMTMTIFKAKTKCVVHENEDVILDEIEMLQAKLAMLRARHNANGGAKIAEIRESKDVSENNIVMNSVGEPSVDICKEDYVVEALQVSSSPNVEHV